VALTNAMGFSPVIMMLAGGETLLFGCIAQDRNCIHQYVPFTVDLAKRHAVIHPDRSDVTAAYAYDNAAYLERHISAGEIPNPHKGV
jgi:hypothetical protein